MKCKVNNIMKTLAKHGRVELNMIGLDLKKVTITKNKAFGFKLESRNKVTFIDKDDARGLVEHLAFFIETYNA